jgi:hypothetical protein
MDDDLLKIYSLMKSAEDQLAALKHATGALAAERAALARDRAALEKTLAEHASGLKTAAANLKTAGANIRQEAQNATPALQEATRKAVEASMAQILTQVSTRAANALEAASGSTLERLTVAIQAAGTAESSLKRAGQWFAWKWVALAAGGTAGVLLIAFLALQLIERSHWNNLTAQRQSLLQDIAQLQETADALEKRTHGLRIVTGSDGAFLVVPKGAQTTQCKAGPCIRLD